MVAVRALLVAASSLATVSQAATCKEHALDFIVLEGDQLTGRIEDDVVRDLAVIGINVNTRKLSKPEFNAAMQSGDFHLCFTSPWGPPYDPHSFATGMFQPSNEAHYRALDGVEPPLTKASLEQMVDNVLKSHHLDRQDQWTNILRALHGQAVSMPLWSRRVPAVVNRRLHGYFPGPQNFDYPIHKVSVVSGSTTVTVAPGAQTGLFVTAGPMDPHTYRPNEFFISNWIYEGLVSYGEGGEIQNQLATKYDIVENQFNGQDFRFTLRTGVKFHDGTAFNCAAVKLTFDHVLHPPLNTYAHGWYNLPQVLQTWRCDGEVFVASTNTRYYPFLQELSLIRPLRILSPECYHDGPGSDLTSQNSCSNPDWNNAPFPGGTSSNLQCRGVKCNAGTGPWKFTSTNNRVDGSIESMVFDRNTDWWGSYSGVEKIILKNFNTSAQVKTALLANDGSLDMVVGIGVLPPTEVRDLRQNQNVQVIDGPSLFNDMIVINSGRTPTDDIQLRKAIIHAVNKSAIVDNELAGSSLVADSMFPRDAPYCDVDLTPRWDYDLEKAKFINCPEVEIVKEAGKGDDDESNLGLILGLSLGIGIPVLCIAVLIAFQVGKKSAYKQFTEEQGNSQPPVVGTPYGNQTPDQA